MKYILKLASEYKLPYYIYNIFDIFFESIGFIIPIALGYIVDMVTIQHNYDHLLLIILGIIIFAILKELGSYFFLIKLDTTGEKIGSTLKQKCYAKINELDYYFFEHNNRGELMTNFTSDINTIRRHLTFNISTIGSVLISFLCSVIYLFTINIPFTLILLTPSLLIGLISYKYNKVMTPKYEKSREYTSLANDFLSDNIEGNKVVKSFALERDEIKKAEALNKQYIDIDIANGYAENSFYSLINFSNYLMNIIFLLIGGYLFIQNKITLGSLVIFNAYLSNLKELFSRLGGILSSIERYKVSLNKIKKVLESTPTIKLPGTKKISTLKVPIEFKNVSIIYDNKVVLENLNFTINPNETIAFIGKTGSGKSSLVSLLLGFVTPSSGEILINGENYLNYNIKDIRSKIGYVAQNALLFSDTIYNNISYGNSKLTHKEALKYADIACCNYIADLPLKENTIIGEKGVGLSGGEKQRLSLARALAVKPDILLLDDITSALDIETEEKINESIHNLHYKSTKIIIASKIVSVKNADKIFVLENGHLIEQGTHEELLKNKGYYYELNNIGRGEENAR